MNGQLHPTHLHTVVVVGAGPAGLAVAGELNRRGIRPFVLEAGPTPGWAWRNHYPWLRLHTKRCESALPGRALIRPQHENTPYASRDEFAAYLDAYAAGLRMDLRVNCPVRRITRDGAPAVWHLETAGGEMFRARHVVMAAGFNRRPVLPELPGQEKFGGLIVHSSRWSELLEKPRRHAETRVLVVGLGNTGADLIAALHEARFQVAVSVRGPLHILPLTIAGIHWRVVNRAVPGTAFGIDRILGKWGRGAAVRTASRWLSWIQERHFGDLQNKGLRWQRSHEIVEHWERGRPPLTPGAFIGLIRRGEVEVWPGIRELEPGGVRLADGHYHACDAIVLATGYRPALEELFSEADLPAAMFDARTPLPWLKLERISARQPGLWFCGYVPELRRICRDARRIGRGIARHSR